MAGPKSAANENEISRDRLAELLNEDLSREYQAIIAYVVYSQVLSGAECIRQCEALGEFATAEQIRQILMQEQDHQIDLATALGIEVPDVSGGPKGRTLGKRR